MNIDFIQSLIRNAHIDGWLLYDFRRSNILACRVLEIPNEQLLTRRFFYWIPREGFPCKIVSSVENPLKHLPGREVIFHSWIELNDSLKTLLEDKTKIAMEYSPDGTTPEVSRVDGGAIDLIKKCKVDVISSGDLLQQVLCVWDEKKWQSHLKAAQVLEDIVENTWTFIATAIKKQSPITEYDVQQFMLHQMDEAGCETSHPPICAINAHSSDPHYNPEESTAETLKFGDWVLIDLWCKVKGPTTVYADITRVGIIESAIPEKFQKIFSIVKDAQKMAFEYVKERHAAKIPMRGYEVDRLARNYITLAGYGDQFVHRLGHNIDESDHGPGAHLDDLETHDERHLLAGTCFSIEPGIYLPNDFGVRLEYDVYLHPNGEALITGGQQESIHKIQ